MFDDGGDGSHIVTERFAAVASRVPQLACKGTHSGRPGRNSESGPISDVNNQDRFEFALNRQCIANQSLECVAAS